MRTHKTRISAAIAAGLLVAGVGGAYAYLNVTGGGTGSATTVSGPLLPIVLHATVSGLSPDTAGKLTVTYDNPNTFMVSVPRISVAIGDLSSGGCAGNTFVTEDLVPSVDVSLRLQKGSGLTLASSAFDGGTVTWVNDAAATNSCLGADIPLTLKVESS